jgi:hypothetical protein
MQSIVPRCPCAPVALNSYGTREPLVANIASASAAGAGTRLQRSRSANAAARDVRELRRFIALHKFDADEAALAATDDDEGRSDSRLLALNVTPIRHQREASLMNKRLRPLLELVGAPVHGGPHAQSGVAANSVAANIDTADARTGGVLAPRLKCTPPPASGADSRTPASDRANRTRLLKRIAQVRAGDEAAAFALLLPKWTLCVAERAPDAGDDAPMLVAAALPHALAPTAVGKLPATSLDASAALSDTSAAWPDAAAPHATHQETAPANRSRMWRSLGALSALSETRALVARATVGVSLQQCRELCAADPSCRSVAYAPTLVGHCMPLATAVTAHAPTKCLVPRSGCDCSCFVTHYLVPDEDEPSVSRAENEAARVAHSHARRRARAPRARVR